jgi:hypothetical protein
MVFTVLRFALEGVAMPPSAADAPFDWPLYADATFAGLSVLIPVPLMDWVFERYFRRRMVAAIARRRGHTLAPAVLAELHQGTGGGLLQGCLMLPLKATVWVLKRVFRKLVYVLTIKDASDQLSYYWQRAFLLAHMLDQGHLHDPATSQRARLAMESVLETSSSPMRGLAGQVIGGAGNILRTLRLARRGTEDATAQATEHEMRQHWADFAPYLRALARRYDEAFERRTQQNSGDPKQ